MPDPKEQNVQDTFHVSFLMCFLHLALQATSVEAALNRRKWT